MGNRSDDLAARLGRTINELDIDFSSFTVAGWLVSVSSLILGGSVAWSVYEAMPKRQGPDNGPALVLGLTMIGITVVSFLVLRWCSSRMGFPVRKETHENNEIDPDEF